MVRSTARFISYDLRPAKQSERTILLDLLRLASEAGFPIKTYRYVGMGANRFYDFLLIHKYLGITRMVSIEHDAVMFTRAQFNCPYSFIDVRHTTTAEFIRSDGFKEPTIVWFDYDGGLGPEIVEDITSLGTKLKLGDLCFATVYGGPPGTLSRQNAVQRQEWLKDVLGDVAASVDIADVENSTFAHAVHKILTCALRFAFSPRREGRFVPLVQVKYSDSSPMVTVGGGFFAEGTALDIERRLTTSMAFLDLCGETLYEIKSLHLTDRERVLFDLAATKPTKRACAERNQLRKMGFGDDEIAAYKELIRYLPRYVESIV